MFANNSIENIIYFLIDYISSTLFLIFCFCILYSNVERFKFKNITIFLFLGSLTFIYFYWKLFYTVAVLLPELTNNNNTSIYTVVYFEIFTSFVYLIFNFAYISKTKLNNKLKSISIAILCIALLLSYKFHNIFQIKQSEALDFCSDSGICKEGLVLIDENGNDWIINKENCALEGRWNDAEKECIMNWSVNY